MRQGGISEMDAPDTLDVQAAAGRFRTNVEKAIVGHADVVELIFIALPALVPCIFDKSQIGSCSLNR